MWRHCVPAVVAVLVLLSCVQAESYGIGFELAMDYGIASIRHTNGTFTDLAIIEGTPAYKAAMRVEADRSQAFFGTEPHIVNGREHSVWDRTRHLGYSPCGIDHWSDVTDEVTEAFASMLDALAAATMSYTGQPPQAMVALPFPPSRSYEVRPNGTELWDTLKRWRDNLYYESVRPPMAAGFWAAKRLIRDQECEYLPARAPYGVPEDERLILSVGYSGAALTALLLVEEGMMLEEYRLLHEIDLGLHGFMERSGSAEAWEWFDHLVSALKRITRPLKPYTTSPTLDKIYSIVLHGDAAGDDIIHAALEVALGEEQHAGAMPKCSILVDPTFVVARELAERSWYWQNEAISEPGWQDW